MVFPRELFVGPGATNFQVRIYSHQQTVENQATNYNPMVPPPEGCNELYWDILEYLSLPFHFRTTGSRKRVITRYKSLLGKRFDCKVMWDFPRLADGRNFLNA